MTNIKIGRAFSVLAVAILAAVLLSGCLGGGGDGGGGETWIPAVGDFVEYEYAAVEMQSTIRTEIVDVTSTSMTINTTTTMQGSIPYSMETTVPINQTLGWSYDIDNLPEGMSMTDHGTDSISTNWGSRTANHYQISYSGEYGSWSGDVYIYAGVLLKMEIEQSGMTLTMTLVDTNLEEITNP